MKIRFMLPMLLLFALNRSVLEICKAAIEWIRRQNVMLLRFGYFLFEYNGFVSLFCWVFRIHENKAAVNSVAANC